MIVEPQALELELTDEYNDIIVNDPDKPFLKLQRKNHRNKIAPALQHYATFNQRRALGRFMQNTCTMRLPLVMLSNCFITLWLTLFPLAL